MIPGVTWALFYIADLADEKETNMDDTDMVPGARRRRFVG